MLSRKDSVCRKGRLYQGKEGAKGAAGPTHSHRPPPKQRVVLYDRKEKKRPSKHRFVVITFFKYFSCFPLISPLSHELFITQRYDSSTRHIFPRVFPSGGCALKASRRAVRATFLRMVFMMGRGWGPLEGVSVIHRGRALDGGTTHREIACNSISDVGIRVFA